jgi:protein ImuA
MLSGKRPTLSSPFQHDTLAELREKLRCLESGNRNLSHDLIVTGCQTLDHFLPEGGWRRGTLIEWLFAEPGSGAATLAMLAARESSRAGGAVVVMDNHCDFYPPAAALLGIDPTRLVVIRAKNQQDQLWALDQALTCRGVAAVWAEQHQIDPHTFRRLQLAAETGNTLGLLLRGERVRGQPTWSEMQLLVQPVRAISDTNRHVRVQWIRGRGQMRQKSVELVIDEATGEIRPTENGDWLRARDTKSLVQTESQDVCPPFRADKKYHEPRTVHSPAQLARATGRCRQAGA